MERCQLQHQDAILCLWNNHPWSVKVNWILTNEQVIKALWTWYYITPSKTKKILLNISHKVMGFFYISRLPQFFRNIYGWLIIQFKHKPKLVTGLRWLESNMLSRLKLQGVCYSKLNINVVRRLFSSGVTSTFAAPALKSRLAVWAEAVQVNIRISRTVIIDMDFFIF